MGLAMFEQKTETLFRKVVNGKPYASLVDRQKTNLEQFFGRAAGHVKSVEFRKRGMLSPHQDADIWKFSVATLSTDGHPS